MLIFKGRWEEMNDLGLSWVATGLFRGDDDLFSWAAIVWKAENRPGYGWRLQVCDVVRSAEPLTDDTELSLAAGWCAGDAECKEHVESALAGFFRSRIVSRQRQARARDAEGC